MVLQGIMFDIVQNVVITPDEFSDAEEIVPILKDIEELLLAAINCPMPPHHPLRPLNELKRQESVLQTLTKSEVETGDLFPGLDDEQVWARLMGRTPEIPIEIGGDNIFHRLSIMLKGKVLGRKVLTTETGFVGIGVPQIEVGDVIAFIYGTTAPLVLRRCGDSYRIVGCAYVSGLMDPDLLDCYYDKMINQEALFNIV
jgi:hypothetical protein